MVSYAYNTLNEQTTLTEPGSPGPQTTFGYDANHHRTTTTYPGNTVQTATYDNAQRLSAISAVNGATTLTNFTYSFTNPTTTKDTLLAYSITQSDSTNRNATTTQTFDVLNHLTEWKVTPGTGSTLNAHDYVYQYDGNGNRTSINADGTISTLYYNAVNEWYKTTATGQTNPNTISWDAAGNLIANDDFGGGPHPLSITYNAKNQLASITDTLQNVIPMAYTGPGQAERVSAGWVSTNPLTPHGAATYTYGSGLLGSTDSIGTTHYTRSPSGTLVSQRVPGTSSNYYYLFDGQGSVIKLVDASGTVVATYAYCPTGNPSDPSFGLAAPGNPYQYLGEYEDTATKMLYSAWGYTDTNSGVTIQLCPLPIGGISYPCLNPLPAQTQTPAFLPCPPTGNSVDNGAFLKGGPLYQRTSGPENAGGNVTCHVNAVGGNVNLHITYNPQTANFMVSGVPLVGTAAEVAFDVANSLGTYIATHGGDPNLAVFYTDWYLEVGALSARLQALTQYQP